MRSNRLTGFESSAPLNTRTFSEMSMKHLIGNPSEIGAIIRAARKAQRLRQDDAAGSVGVSESFMVKVERVPRPFSGASCSRSWKAWAHA